jgi:hypothetical protein
VDVKGKEAAFDLRKGPPAGTTPLFPLPEALDRDRAGPRAHLRIPASRRDTTQGDEAHSPLLID